MTQVQSKILIVEDDFISQQVLQAMLSCYPLTVQCVGSGAEAIQAVSTFQPCLLLLDHELPDITGIALYQQLAVHVPTAQVALISSHEPDQLQAAASAAGIPHLLTKPLEPHHLADLLRVTGCIE